MWIVEMSLKDLKTPTRKKYFNRIHTIWRGWKSAPCENPFEATRDAIDCDFTCSNEEANVNLDLLHKLINRPNDAVGQEYVNLFLYLFYNPTATMSDAINMAFDDTTLDCPQIDNIVESQKAQTKRVKNVFGLGQGRKREPQIISETLQELQAIGNLVGMRFSGEFSRESITALWIAAALKAGVSVADIRSIINSVPSEYSSLRLVPVVPLSEQQKTAIIRKVADSIDNTPKQWFVMRMRKGQTLDSVKKEIEEKTAGILSEMTFYYPTYKVVKMSPKGKPIKKDIPYLPSILFFRVNRDKVAFLMHRIGKVAWCYKYVISTESEYCTISRNEMRKFQNHIGQFTPDIRMELISRDEPYEEGTEVKICGGTKMPGHIGIITSVKNEDGTRTYTLTLSDKDYAKWTVRDIEEVFIEPLNR